MRRLKAPREMIRWFNREHRHTSTSFISLGAHDNPSEDRCTVHISHIRKLWSKRLCDLPAVL